MGRSGCPTVADLLAFHRGELPEDALDALADHLETCPRCEERARAVDAIPDPALALLQAGSGSVTPRAASGIVIPEVARPPAPVPDRIGPYEVIGELGRGGMGVVYKVWHPELQRVVALKMMLGGSFADLSARERFRSEAAAVARMQHPHIVQIFEVGEHENQPYFTLEYVAGGSLREQLRQATPWPRQAARWVESVARAAHAAHEQGIIHRDLKPPNVLLTPDGTPKITDFGLAKLLYGTTPHTMTGLVVGTAEYMAPEQTTGDAAVGPAVDVYALGVILYELLIGHPPFHCSNPLDTLSQVRTQDPVPPCRLQPRLSRDLETICLKCLRKEPALRYATALDLAEDLRCFLANEPIRARPISIGRWAVKWARCRPAVAGLLAGLVLVASLGLSGILWQWRDAVEQRQLAETKERDAVQARDQAEANVYFSRIAQVRLEWGANHNVAGASDLLAQCLPTAGQTDRRNWEWHYLTGLNRADLDTMRGHSGTYVHDLAFSPDGRFIASAGGGNTFYASNGKVTPGEVILWDTATGRPRHVLRGHQHLVLTVAFSADASRLASAGLDGKVHVWDIRSDPPVELTRLTGSAAAAFSPDGKQLLTGRGETAVLVDVASGKPIREFPGHRGSVHRAAFSRDGQRVATGTWANNGPAEVCVWDVSTARRLHRFAAPSLRIDGLTFSPDGKLLAAAHGRAQIWDVKTGRSLQTIGTTSSILAIAFSPDGLELATGGADRTVRFWRVADGTEHRVLRGHRGRVSCLAFDPTGTGLASGDEQPGEIKRWDLTRPLEYQVLHTRGSHIPEGLAFDEAGQTVLTLVPGGALKLLDVSSGEARQERYLESYSTWMSPACRVAFVRGGSRVAAVSGSDPRVVKVWDTADGKELKALFCAPGDRIFRLALSRDGRWLAASTIGHAPNNRVRQVSVWDVQTGQMARSAQVAVATDSLFRGGLALSPDGSRLAFDEWVPPASDGDKAKAMAHVWDIADGNDRKLPGELDAAVGALQFSEDGRLLAAADGSGKVTIWDVPAGELLHAKTPQGFCVTLAFSPDGTRLAGAGREEIKMWDVSSGQEVLVLRGAGPRPGDNGFNPEVVWSLDGRRLAAINWDGSISVWDSTPRDTPEARELAVREAAARAPAYHLVRAEAALGRFPHAFDFHWKQVVAAPPPAQATMLRVRGTIRARLGQWPQAADDFARVTALQPEPMNDWAILACLRLLSGDADAYRNIRQQVLHRSSRADDTLRAALIGCLGNQPDDRAQLVSLAQAARKSTEPSAEVANVLALAFYRAGRLNEAMGQVEKAPKGSATQQGIGGAIRTLCLLRRDRTEDARAAWAEADRAFSLSPPTPDAPLRVSWLLYDLWFLVLRAELESRLNDPAR